MLMVGNVILNRTNHDNYPSKIKKVVYQKRQFSYLNGKKSVKIYEKDSWENAKRIATFLILLEKTNPDLRKLYDPTKGALFYLKKGTRVSWLKSVEKTVTYKNHNFYVETS